MFPLVVGTSPLRASDVTEVPISIARSGKLYPINVAGTSMGARVTYVPTRGQQVPLEGNQIQSLIDADKASGIELPAGQHQILISLRKTPRIHKITLTGDFGRSTATIRLARIPLSASDGDGWTTVVENQTLQTPSTTFLVKPQEAIRALVTINVREPKLGMPTLSDVALFSNQDLRNYRLKDNSKVMTAVSSSTRPEGASRFNFASMYAGTRVTHVEGHGMDLRQANHLTDDNAATYLELPDSRDSFIVMDLGEDRWLEQVSLTHSPNTGEILVYVVDDLPWGEKPVNTGMPVPSPTELPEKVIDSVAEGVASLSPFGAKKNDLSPALLNATIIRLTSQATLIRKVAGESAARQGDQLAQGDELRTSAEGSAEIKFEDSSVVRMGPNTSFSYLSKERTVVVNYGNILVHVPPNKGGIVVQTPTSNARLIGDTLVCNVLPNGSAQFIALSRDSSGPIIIEPINRSIPSCPLDAGQMVVIAATPMGSTQPTNIDARQFVRSTPLCSDMATLPVTARTEIDTAIRISSSGQSGNIPKSQPSSSSPTITASGSKSPTLTAIEKLEPFAKIDASGKTLSSFKAPEVKKGRKVIVRFVAADGTKENVSSTKPKIYDINLIGSIESTEPLVLERSPVRILNTDVVSNSTRPVTFEEKQAAFDKKEPGEPLVAEVPPPTVKPSPLVSGSGDNVSSSVSGNQDPLAHTPVLNTLGTISDSLTPEPSPEPAPASGS
jgi:hypothetical protein